MRFSCPGCGAVYNVESKDRLVKSGGQVECYRCGHVFQVLAALPDPGRSRKRPADSRPAVEDATAGPRPEQQPKQQPPPDSDHAAALSDYPDHSHLLAPGPEAHAAVRRPSPLATLAWTLGVVALLTGLGGQALWHFRGDPRVHEVLQAFCGRAGCEVPPLRRPDAFTVTERVFTRIPDDPEVLVLRLRLANQSALAQPYPGVELLLYDDAQAVVGKSRVVPEDYLNAATPDHLEPGELGELELHILDPGQAATGFEVDFF